MNTQLKLGLKPATIDHRDIPLHEVLDGALADELRQAPPGWGHWPKVSKLGEQWGMLGNDAVGDCAWAGPAHETMLWNALNGVVVKFTTAGVLSDYSACTGYDPNDPWSDQGTDMRQGLLYRQQTGVVDATGTRHKIGAFVALEPGNWTQLLEALYAFDSVAIGFRVPSYAMNQFNAGKPWSYLGAGSITGGHYTPAFGRPGLSRIRVCTWGTLQDMTRSFYEHFNDQTFAVLSPESLSSGGLTAEGLDLNALQAALATL